MIQFLRNRTSEFHATFHDSEVLLWARSQYLMLALYQGLQAIDISVFISDRHILQGYIFANAVITEMLRRSREDWKHDA